jgi:hypothetical protein
MYTEIKIRGQELYSRFKDIEQHAQDLGIYEQLRDAGLRNECPCYDIAIDITQNADFLLKCITYENKVKEYKQLVELYFNTPRE